MFSREVLVEWCEGLTEVSITIQQYSLDCKGVRLKGICFPLLSSPILQPEPGKFRGEK